jgi:uncharacterized protein YdeI (YjbR/CyaY-like superfamily)
MTEFGLRKIEMAKQNGSWNKLDSVDIRIETPKDLKDALAQHNIARKKYEKLPHLEKSSFYGGLKVQNVMKQEKKELKRQ